MSKLLKGEWTDNSGCIFCWVTSGKASPKVTTDTNEGKNRNAVLMFFGICQKLVAEWFKAGI